MSSHFFTSRDKPTTANNSRFNFPNFDFSQIPLPNIRVPNFSQTFSTAPDSFNRFMSPLRGNERRNGRNSPAYCDSCETKFNIFTKRKKTCLDCSMDFCTDCFVRESPSTRCGRCKKCFIFSRFPPDRSSLMTLRVRDLRWYLAQRRIPARYCKEKTDLVELIIQSSSSNGEQRSPSNEQMPPPPPSSSSTAPAGADSEADSSTGSSTDSNWVFVNSFGYDDSSAQSQATASSDTAAAATTQFKFTASACDNVQTEAPTTTTTSTDETASTSSQIYNSENQLFNISDLKSESDVRALSVRQMKLLLTRNFVDYKGCCEKEELLAKTLRLWRDNKQQEDPESIKDENLCKICMEAEINCVLLECGHMVTCNNCGKKLNECPICRQYVVRVIRTFKS